MSTAAAASSAASAAPSSPPMQAGALKKRVQFENSSSATITSTSSSGSLRITPVAFAPTPAGAVITTPVTSPTYSNANAASAEVVVSSVVVQGFTHKGHYLCEECSDEMMEILLGKALEKRQRRVRMKRQLLRDAGVVVDVDSKTSAYNASSVIVETY